MSAPDDENEIVGEDAVNAWLDRVRIISVKAVSSSAPKGRSLPFTTRWPVSAAVAADLNAIPIDADTMAAAAFAAANLRAWADYVEKTGDGLRVEPYSISVDTPLDRHIGMAPLASCGSVGWRHAPKLQHRNRGFGDHGSLWSDHHKHATHPPLPNPDEPPPEPPCPRCTLALYICRCDEDDLREALRERDARIKMLEARLRIVSDDDDRAMIPLGTSILSPGEVVTLDQYLDRKRSFDDDPRCYAVDEPTTPRRGPKRDWSWAGKTCRHERPSHAWSTYRYVNLSSIGTPICCPKVRLRGRSVRRRCVEAFECCAVTP